MLVQLQRAAGIFCWRCSTGENRCDMSPRSTLCWLKACSGRETECS